MLEMLDRYALYLIAGGLFLAEIGLLIAIRSCTKELRGMRADIPRVAASFMAFGLLAKAAEIYTKKEDK